MPVTRHWSHWPLSTLIITSFGPVLASEVIVKSRTTARLLLIVTAVPRSADDRGVLPGALQGDRLVDVDAPQAAVPAGTTTVSPSAACAMA